MSIDTSDEPERTTAQHQNHCTPFLSHLQEKLISCSKSIETGDFRQSDDSINAFVDFLESVCESALSDPIGNGVSKGNALEVLAEIHQFISSPSSNQMVVDAISLELPKVVAKFAGVSDECKEVSESILDVLVSISNPRDMLSIFCEALCSLSKVFKAPGYFVPILSGISKVSLGIRRHHFEQVKVAVPVILNVLKEVSSETDEVESSLNDLISKVISIADSIQAVCEKLGDNRKEELNALLGLYVLQVMALISSSCVAEKISNCIFFVQQLSHFLPFCGLSYLGLITGCDVDRIINMVSGDESEDFMSCFSLVKHGASLAVIWGHISHEVANAAGEEVATVKDKLRRSLTKTWQTAGMLRYIFFSTDLSWELKNHGIDLFLSIMDENNLKDHDDDHTDFSLYSPSLFSALQAVEVVIIYAPDAELRKKAFASLKRVLTNLQSGQRFDILKALITNSNSSSMIALLIDLVREEILVESRQKVSQRNDQIKDAENIVYPLSPFCSSDVLDLVEFVLKPPKGGPPSLPEHSDAVVSALNLYRFILIRESTGKTNHTGILSLNTLRKAYSEWLLPLRTLVSGIQAANEKDYDEFAGDTICAVNPVQFVLYRCIELVEDNLKQCRGT